MCVGDWLCCGGLGLGLGASAGKLLLGSVVGATKLFRGVAWLLCGMRLGPRTHLHCLQCCGLLSPLTFGLIPSPMFGLVSPLAVLAGGLGSVFFRRLGSFFSLCGWDLYQNPRFVVQSGLVAPLRVSLLRRWQAVWNRWGAFCFVGLHLMACGL